MKTASMVALLLVLGGALGCERREQSQPESTTTTSSEPMEKRVGQSPPMGNTVQEPSPANVPTTDQPQAQAPSGTGQGTTPAANPTPGQNPAATPLPGSSGQAGQQASAGQAKAAAGKEAEAELKTVKGIDLNGTAKLEDTGNGVRVTLKLEDAPPGKRGVHIHQVGDCSNIAGESMGAHLSMPGEKHGLPGAPTHHFGDLGNINVAQDGSGTLDIVVPGANLKEDDRMSLLGKALVIHTAEDKGTGPGGGAGQPIACAEIKPD